jgi:2-polyprenyl-3-methyl-5-hydroxy-6-metoxy-1,4-benzoquinol methylase
MRMEARSETERLAGIASESWYGKGVNAATVAYSVRVFSRHWQSGSCLELGPAEGIATAELVKRFADLTCVDGAPSFCAALKERYPAVAVECTLFEQYETKRRFDNIVLGHVLEHVDDPVEILTRVREWLGPDGRVFAAVPNARSVHRQIAVVMGLLQREDELNEADHHHGHRRVYNPESFRHDFLRAGLQIEIFGGYWLKPVSNRQIEQSWTAAMVEAAMSVGERYPDIAAEIYVVARK